MVVQQGMEATIAMIASDGARLREMELSDPEALGGIGRLMRWRCRRER